MPFVVGKNGTMVLTKRALARREANTVKRGRARLAERHEIIRHFLAQWATVTLLALLRRAATLRFESKTTLEEVKGPS